MHPGRIARLSVLALGLAGTAWATGAVPLADAAEEGNAALVGTLLHAGGADVNAAQVDGMTVLHWAAYHDDLETAGLLVRAGADVDAVNRYGVPPLALAATNGNAGLVSLLLDAGADPAAALPGAPVARLLSRIPCQTDDLRPRLATLFPLIAGGPPSRFWSPVLLPLRSPRKAILEHETISISQGSSNRIDSAPSVPRTAPPSATTR